MTAPGARRQKYDPFGDLLEGEAALLYCWSGMVPSSLRGACPGLLC